MPPSEPKPVSDLATTHTPASQNAQAVLDPYDARASRIADWRRRLQKAIRLEERLQVLHDFGLTDTEIARAIPDGKARSVRRWRQEGVARGRTVDRWEPIDDLCAIIGFLLSDGTYDEEAATAWLCSRRPELGHARPLDMLGVGEFAKVFEAAEVLLGPGVSTGGPLSRPELVGGPHTS